MDIIQLIITSVAFLFFAIHWILKIKKIEPSSYKYLKDIFRRYFSISYFAFVSYAVILPNVAINQYVEIEHKYSHKIMLTNNSSEAQYYLFKQKIDTGHNWLLSTYATLISNDHIFSLNAGESQTIQIGNYSYPINKTIIENISDSLQTDSTIKAAAFNNLGSSLLCKHSDLREKFVKQEVDFSNFYIEVFSLLTIMLGAMLFFFHGKKLWQKIIINLASFGLMGFSTFLMIDKIRILLYYYFGVLI